LLRQYFINHFSSPPSPAMTKAYLMNSTRYLTGLSANDNLWSNNQGMGGINLGMAFDGTPRRLRDQNQADLFTASGQIRVFSGRVADTSKPFRVTLAWTDAPGSTVGAAYNNNLDLTVTIGGNTYFGNVFRGAYSITGGSADPVNNVESVFLPVGTTGDFVVSITAANINSDGVPNNDQSLDQDFALVIYNSQAAAITPPRISQVSLVGHSITVQFDSVSGATYTLQSKNSLLDSSWVSCSPRTSGTDATISLVDTNALAPTRFYRVICE